MSDAPSQSKRQAVSLLLKHNEIRFVALFRKEISELLMLPDSRHEGLITSRILCVQCKSLIVIKQIEAAG